MSWLMACSYSTPAVGKSQAPASPCSSARATRASRSMYSGGRGSSAERVSSTNVLPSGLPR